MALNDLSALSFDPGAATRRAEGHSGAGWQSGGAPVQQAISLLRLVYPRVVGARAVAPQPLLESAGALGTPANQLEMLLRRMFAPESMPLPQAPQAPVSRPSQPVSPPEPARLPMSSYQQPIAQAPPPGAPSPIRYQPEPDPVSRLMALFSGAPSGASETPRIVPGTGDRARVRPEESAPVSPWGGSHALSPSGGGPVESPTLFERIQRTLPPLPRFNVEVRPPDTSWYG